MTALPADRTGERHRQVARAYSQTNERWQSGPGHIYDRLARLVLAEAPIPVGGSRVLDVGTGTGAAARAALRLGAASVTAIDAAVGMLAVDARIRPPAVAGDARDLPFANGRFDLAVAAFSLNHLTDPEIALAELSRVVRPTGAIVASSYAVDDAHPVKGAVEGALTAAGWTSPGWHQWLKDEAMPLLATVDGFLGAAAAAGLGDAAVTHRRVAFPELGADDLVRWRLGMAQHAAFVDGLRPDAVRRIEEDARARLPDPLPPLVRSVLVLRALVPAR